MLMISVYRLRAAKIYSSGLRASSLLPSSICVSTAKNCNTEDNGSKKHKTTENNPTQKVMQKKKESLNHLIRHVLALERLISSLTSSSIYTNSSVLFDLFRGISRCHFRLKFYLWYSQQVNSTF